MENQAPNTDSTINTALIVRWWMLHYTRDMHQHTYPLSQRLEALEEMLMPGSVPMD